MSTSLVIDVLDDEVVVERRGADGVVSGRAVVPVASTGYRVDPEVWWTALVDAVDAVVVETQDMPALLGMSFLNRMDMRREGQSMVLTRRY